MEFTTLEQAILRENCIKNTKGKKIQVQTGCPQGEQISRGVVTNLYKEQLKEPGFDPQCASIPPLKNCNS